MSDRERLGRTFDRAAELYQDARPEYPDALLDRLMEVTQLRPGDRVLEVGPGTGKATLPLVRRGLQVTAVEPGAALAAQARANLAGHPVEVINQRFENWDAQPGAYAAVVAATAWHWLDPELRVERVARALRRAGHLAIWSAQHVFPVGGDPFFDELQEVYEEIGEAPRDGAPKPAPGELRDMTDEIRAARPFQVVSVDHFDWTVDYTAEAYIDLLRTFSGHIAMAPADRDHLFGEIRRRVALRPSGTVRRGWGAVLHIARKV